MSFKTPPCGSIGRSDRCRSSRRGHATNLGRPGAPSGIDASHDVSDAPDPAASLDRWTQFHDAIASLPDDLREIFHLVWYLDADQKTIAGLLGCSERTVKSRWREAREAVRAALDGHAPE
jgi:RNA polymerase sigma factor (sigma-70 family)